MTGCKFAAALASNTYRRVAYSEIVGPFTDEDPPHIEGFIDWAADQHKVAILLFPHLRTEEDIAHVIRLLARRPRWKAERVEWRNHAREDSVLIALPWESKSGTLSETMGFAPLGAMPVTRRAPYVAFAVWAAGNENPFRANGGSRLGLVDAAHDQDRNQYDSAWKTTEEMVGRMLLDPPEDAGRLRKAAFCLSRSVVEKHLADVL